jgi:hypothetical protein
VPQFVLPQLALWSKAHAAMTKYSDVFDLKSCAIWLYRFPEHAEPAPFNLPHELKKGSHYDDRPELAQQADQELRPLSEDMKRD